MILLLVKNISYITQSLRFAVQATASTKTANSVFKVLKLPMGLLFNVHFLTTDGLLMDK